MQRKTCTLLNVCYSLERDHRRKYVVQSINRASRPCKSSTASAPTQPSFLANAKDDGVAFQ